MDFECRQLLAVPESQATAIGVIATGLALKERTATLWVQPGPVGFSLGMGQKLEFARGLKVTHIDCFEQLAIQQTGAGIAEFRWSIQAPATEVIHRANIIICQEVA